MTFSAADLAEAYKTEYLTSGLRTDAAVANADADAANIIRLRHLVRDAEWQASAACSNNLLDKEVHETLISLVTKIDNTIRETLEEPKMTEQKPTPTVMPPGWVSAQSAAQSTVMPPGWVSVPPTIERTQGLDGDAHLTYYDRENSLSFVWNGGYTDPIEIALGGYGEPPLWSVDATTVGTSPFQFRDFCLRWIQENGFHTE